MAEWPAELQQYLNVGVTLAHLPSFVISPVTSGPPKTRRTFTTNLVEYRGEMQMDPAQYEIFQRFYYNASLDSFAGIGGGALPFTMENPQGTGRVRVRFAEPFNTRIPTFGIFMVSMNLIILGDAE